MLYGLCFCLHSCDLMWAVEPRVWSVMTGALRLAGCVGSHASRCGPGTLCWPSDAVCTRRQSRRSWRYQQKVAGSSWEVSGSCVLLLSFIVLWFGCFPVHTFLFSIVLLSLTCSMVHDLFCNNVNLLTAITLGGAYVIDGVSPVGLQNHVICCSCC